MKGCDIAVLIILMRSLVVGAAYEEVSSEGRYMVTRMNGGAPLVTEGMFQGLGAGLEEGVNMNGPSVIRIPSWISVDQRADPSAIYYLYFAHHSGQYIRMAWSSEIAGPWTLYDVGTGISLGDRGVLDLGDAEMPIGNGIVIPNNHLASPNVHIDAVNQRIIMYFHSGSTLHVDGNEVSGQKTFVAISDYGLDFSGGVEPVILGDSYFTVFGYDDELYALDNGAGLWRAPHSIDPWNPPSGWVFSDALWDEASVNGYREDLDDDGYSSSELRVRHASTWVEGDALHAFYSRRGVTPPERLMLSVTDLSASSNYDEWDPSYPPEEIYRAQPGWEGGQFADFDSETSAAPENVDQLRDPFLFEDDDGSLYLFYTGGGEDALGALHLEPIGHDPSDVAAPTPSTMAWESVPVAIAAGAIEMKAFLASDTNGVKYYFENITDSSHDSGWQVSPCYRDTGLAAGTTYAYRVRARDRSVNQNQNNFSASASATTPFPATETIFETFDTDPTSRGWMNDSAGATTFSYNDKGYLDVIIQMDEIHRANYYKMLDISLDEATEFWMEMDVSITSSSNGLAHSLLGLFNSSAGGNDTNFVGSRFTYGSQENRIDLRSHAADGDQQGPPSEHFGTGLAYGQSVRVKLHYFNDGVGRASLNVYEIDEVDGSDGAFLMGSTPKTVIGFGDRLLVDGFGIGNRNDKSYLGFNEGLIDNLYFSVVRANPAPRRPSWIISPYERWAAEFELTNPTNDPDKDGVNNLYEFAFGGDPTHPGWAGYLPRAEISSSGFQYVYVRREDSGLKYYFETSTNLLSNVWTNSGFVELETTGIVAEGFESITNEVFMESAQKFGRLIILDQ